MSDTLSTTLADIKAAEVAEKEAAHDAYKSLVQDMATETLAVTAGAVVAILKRAGRTTAELAVDVQRAKRLRALEAEAGQLDRLLDEQTAAEQALEQANAVWERKRAEIDRPAQAALAAHESARDRVRACQLSVVQLKHAQAEQKQIDLKRGHAGGEKKATAETDMAELLEFVMED